MLLGSKWTHRGNTQKDKTAGEKQTQRWEDERTKEKRGFELSQYSITLSLNPARHCVVSDFDELCAASLHPSPPAHCSPHRRSHSRSSAAVILCPPLHCRQYKWALFKNGKVRKFDVCSPTISERAGRGREKDRGGTRMWRGHLVSFTHFSCRDSVHPAWRICNEPLLFVTDIPPRPPCWLRRRGNGLQRGSFANLRLYSSVHFDNAGIFCLADVRLW